MRTRQATLPNRARRLTLARSGRTTACPDRCDDRPDYPHHGRIHHQPAPPAVHVAAAGPGGAGASGGGRAAVLLAGCERTGVAAARRRRLRVLPLSDVPLRRRRPALRHHSALEPAPVRRTAFPGRQPVGHLLPDQHPALPAVAQLSLHGRRVARRAARLAGRRLHLPLPASPDPVTAVALGSGRARRAGLDVLRRLRHPRRQSQPDCRCRLAAARLSRTAPRLPRRNPSRAPELGRRRRRGAGHRHACRPRPDDLPAGGLSRRLRRLPRPRLPANPGARRAGAARHGRGRAGRGQPVSGLRGRAVHRARRLFARAGRQLRAALARADRAVRAGLLRAR